MITFYALKNDPDCLDIKDTLDSLKTVHKIITVESKDDEKLPEDKKAPLIVYESETYQGIKEIYDFLEKQKEYEKQWYKFQSDACYYDDEGEIQ